jgi:hypothetical protein
MTNDESRTGAHRSPKEIIPHFMEGEVNIKIGLLSQRVSRRNVIVILENKSTNEEECD